ncbi:MAG TPA: DAK2 domain-containing protein [Chloroflexota bacterium]|nr:DAK2 domain-containing protein [Chloroflexota bacterium]
MDSTAGVSDVPMPRGDVDTLRRLFVAAELLLSRRATRIDRVNVFPVPDGDTGTNLARTLRAAVQTGLSTPASEVGELASAVARGALLGASGNSGVILSQYLHGFAQGLASVDELDGAAFGQALKSAATAARAAVAQPVEGTILTAARKVAEATSACDGTLAGALDTAVRAAKRAVSQTTDELPKLREAGVVDAGALGLATILEGMLQGARGEEIAEDVGTPEDAPAISHLAEESFGYCTEFLLRGDRLDLLEIRARLTDLGDSLLVVGDETLVRVHLHTLTPGEAIDRVLNLGLIDAVKIDDMQRQSHALHPAEVAPESTAATGTTLAAPVGEAAGAIARTVVVSVAPGEGFGRLFRSLGVGAVVAHDSGRNLGAEDLLAAIGGATAEAAILLPNNPDLVTAAEQVVHLAECPVVVIPTRDAAQGVAASLAFRPDQSLEPNRRAMLDAVASIRTAEIIRAAKGARLGEHVVPEGDSLGMIAGQPSVAARDLLDTVVLLLEKLEASTAEVITLYVGAEESAESAALAEARVRVAFPAQQVDLVAGGQDHIPYILACE